jgi:hypothetical protein
MVRLITELLTTTLAALPSTGISFSLSLRITSMGKFSFAAMQNLSNASEAGLKVAVLLEGFVTKPIRFDLNFTSVSNSFNSLFLRLPLQ